MADLLLDTDVLILHLRKRGSAMLHQAFPGELSLWCYGATVAWSTIAAQPNRGTIMSTTVRHGDLNIYLDDLDLRTKIRIDSACSNVSPSAYCREAIRRRLAKDGFPSEPEPIKPSVREATQAESRAAASALDRFRRQVGPTGGWAEVGDGQADRRCAATLARGLGHQRRR
jgi:hypothetical protein